jgi:hypothetical protein
MATIKEITHDSSQILADFYDTVSNPGGVMTITSAAALRGSIFGVNISADGAEPHLITPLPETSDDFRWRFVIKLNGITNNNAGAKFFQLLLGAGALPTFEIGIFANAGDSGFNIVVSIDQDGKGGNATLTGTIPSSGETCIELRAIRETGESTNDGEAELFVNGVSQDSDLTLNNNNVFITIDELRIDLLTDPDISGDLFYDEWILVDDNTANLGCSDFVGYDLVIGGGQP